MSLTNAPPTSSASRPAFGHSHNVSINSAASITEPTTPPSVLSTPKLYFWESNKQDGCLVLPSFSLDSIPSLGHSHSRNISADSSGSDKENKTIFEPLQGRRGAGKIDKEYLVSIIKTPLAQISSEILRLAKDQHGCRFLQKRIDETYVASASSRRANYKIIFDQVKSSLYELIIDPFGNYLVQKLIDYMCVSDLDFCLQSLSSNIFLISINQHGTRALQKIIEKINTEPQYDMLVKGSKPYIIELIKDLNGNHVIQKILNKYSPEKCQFIYDSILADLLTVATHKHGCCVLQKCLNHVSDTQHVAFAKIILKYDNFSVLVNDQFGNYVLQYLISINSIDVNCKLYQNIYEYGTTNLCVLKFSSNVIEKLMMNCFKNEAKLIAFSNLKFTIILHLLLGELNKLINNAYGNYVVQTLIDILINPKAQYFVEMPSGEKRMLPALSQLLCKDLQVSTDTLQVQIIKRWFQDCKIDSTFGKKIHAKINNILNGGGKINQKKSPSSSSLRFGYDFEADQLVKTLKPPDQYSNNCNHHNYGSHQASEFSHPVPYNQQQIPLCRARGFQGGQTLYNTVNRGAQINHLSYGLHAGQAPHQIYSTMNSENCQQNSPAHVTYQQELANLHNASYPVLNNSKMESFNSTNLNNTRAGYYRKLKSPGYSHMAENRFLSPYEEANVRVAHASFLKDRQWFESPQHF